MMKAKMNKKTFIILEVIVLLLVNIILIEFFVFDSSPEAKKTEKSTIYENVPKMSTSLTIVSGRLYSAYNENNDNMQWFGGTYAREDCKLVILVKDDFWNDDPKITEWYKTVISLKRSPSDYIEDDLVFEKCKYSYNELQNLLAILANDPVFREKCSGSYEFDERHNCIKIGCKLYEIYPLWKRLKEISDPGMYKFEMGENYNSRNL